MNMEDYTGVLWIAGILGVVLFMGTLKTKAEWIVNFVLRGIMGMLGIYFVNMALAASMPQISMGYNLITFLVSGVLGLPGVALLYGVNFYMVMV